MILWTNNYNETHIHMWLKPIIYIRAKQHEHDNWPFNRTSNLTSSITNIEMYETSNESWSFSMISWREMKLKKLRLSRLIWAEIQWVKMALMINNFFQSSRHILGIWMICQPSSSIILSSLGAMQLNRSPNSP